MVDKYAHLRAPKPRSCHRRDGVPKRPYTRRQAFARASLVPGYHHYRCPQCGHWHVGREKTT